MNSSGSLSDLMKKNQTNVMIGFMEFSLKSNKKNGGNPQRETIESLADTMLVYIIIIMIYKSIQVSRKGEEEPLQFFLTTQNAKSYG